MSWALAVAKLAKLHNAVIWLNQPLPWMDNMCHPTLGNEGLSDLSAASGCDVGLLGGESCPLRPIRNPTVNKSRLFIQSVFYILL